MLIENHPSIARAAALPYYKKIPFQLVGNVIASILNQGLCEVLQDEWLGFAHTKNISQVGFANLAHMGASHYVPSSPFR